MTIKDKKDVHLVLEETKDYNEGDGIKVTLDTSQDKEELDYEIYIDAPSEAGYAGCDCTMSLKDLIYKIKDIIPYEWIADIKEENNMRKDDYIPKTCNADIYGKLAREEANKHTTVNDFIEEMKPEITTCNICGRLITKKMGMMSCGPYHSDRTGKYVCPHCYDKYVQPLIDGLAEMESTTHREELMKELEYRC